MSQRLEETENVIQQTQQGINEILKWNKFEILSQKEDTYKMLELSKWNQEKENKKFNKNENKLQVIYEKFAEMELLIKDSKRTR